MKSVFYMLALYMKRMHKAFTLMKGGGVLENGTHEVAETRTRSASQGSNANVTTRNTQMFLCKEVDM